MRADAGLSVTGGERCAHFLHLRVRDHGRQEPRQAMGTMVVRRSEEAEQKLIDHEVRRSRVRAAQHRFTVSRDRFEQRESSRDDRRWYRRELIDMLAAARTEEDLRGLGLTDAVVREARLGDTLLEAWARFGPVLLPPHIDGRSGGSAPAAPRVPSGTARGANPA